MIYEISEDRSIRKVSTSTTPAFAVFFYGPEEDITQIEGRFPTILYTEENLRSYLSKVTVSKFIESGDIMVVRKIEIMEKG